ncbi:MAG: RluA family pseudouridine synthase [Allosphingosinicella sp.]|uniref:RluA family pseudouridine synthase n=1 Tax=Allosphingosinicella sp. TaxID=2823234 RepID=UPI00392888C8
MAMFEDRILFIDGEAIVLDKPAGLAVHPGPATPRSLEDHLQQLRFGFHRPPTPVHRLDRDTSGCLLLARNPKAHKRFAAAFEAGQVAKAYLAVLDGIPTEREGRIELPLKKVSSREAGWRMVPDSQGQRAVTNWSVVAEARGRALVRFEPETGRTHQLRVHAASALGVPILGDPVYGESAGFTMLLHAVSLRLERGAKPPVDATAPLPQSFANAGFADAL